MDKLRYCIAFFVAKMGQNILRLFKKNATYFPGKMAIKICPKFLKYIKKPEKIVFVTGTNGKTTVCNMINDILTDNGYDILNNRLGSNINSGIASSLIEGCTWTGKNKKHLAIFEVDERSSRLIYPYVIPNYLVCTNLFRDSIKRNAHTDFIVGIINSVLPETTKLILNADDLIACSLGKNNEKVYFGIDKLDTDVKETTNIIKDIRVCPKCNTKLEYNYARYHHIGNAYCPNCEFKSPNSDYLITKIDKENKQITVKNGNEEFNYSTIASSVFNIYNEIAAITLLRQLGLSEKMINDSLKKLKIVETRISEENINGITVISHLSKGQNPVAGSRVFDYVQQEEGEKSVILILDDCDDAKNSSENLTWLYDADFELLNDDSIKQIIIGGVRCYDYYLRLLIAGVEKSKLKCVENELETVDFLEKDKINKLFILHDIYKYDVALKLKEKFRKEEM